MNPEEISQHLERLRIRFKELETKLADSSIYSRQEECRKIFVEHRKLNKLFENYDKWCSALKEIEENRQLLNNENDEEFKILIGAEIEKLNNEIISLEKTIRLALLPPDPNDSRNIIVEIRPAAGGEEAALFASDMSRMYKYYAERREWKYELLNLTPSELSGIKEVVFSLAGDDVFSRMKYEIGVHRVQRIPVTESGGRIHTSTVTVAVLPEAEEVEIKIKPEDLRIDVFRSSGPGGQSVNTTDSAVRITHLPTGLTVSSQQEKSQHRNKEIAMRILRARILEQQQQEEAAKQAAFKRAQIGTGKRSERIRTYNFPQNRITDHRFNATIHGLPKLLDGELDILLEEIITIDCERQLKALEKGS